jgi:putative hydrolase of the HAD superfamily
MIKAVVFDCDGLLIDTETPWYEAFRQIYREHGVDLPLDLYVKCVGSTFEHFNPFDYLEECINRPLDRDQIRHLCKEKYSKIIQKQQLRSGVEQYLKTAQKLGLKIGLASSSNRSWVDKYLHRYDLAHYFETIHTADDVHKVKPDPALYWQALDSLGAFGSETIVFEDSVNGLKAAKAAGAYCVIVPNPVTANLPFDHYDLRLNSMSDMALQDVIHKVTGKHPGKRKHG